ncbi:uncharacterized protein LOC111384573 [Olea europaea subsp. europaea]|uniref:Uncharacterized protein LOC111384573 n=1 Tax=Olea europaea subsp. europaea TaxID=158383 RepID=A0A8S0UNT5_OLEEU|nr:uncharacterized protein LOC111384573 [Olea europaea subsp. europaea]
MAELPEIVASSSTSSGCDKSFEEVDSLNKQTQVPALRGLQSANGDVQKFPFMYPALVPQLFSQQDQEQMNRGPGLYAVPVLPFAQPISGFPSNTLIPFTYNLPVERSSSETGAVGDVQGQVGEQPHQQQQQPGPQREVIVRRFQIVFHLDVALIVKLVAVIFLFSQDGSRERLTLLVFFALLIYLYQTGVLAPLVRWLSQGMHRAAPPRRPLNPAARPFVPAAQREANDIAAAAAGGQPEGQNENPQVNDANRAVENEHEVEHAEGEVGNHRWWGIVKEIQMIVFGFITSLLPGFHNID